MLDCCQETATNPYASPSRLNYYPNNRWAKLRSIFEVRSSNDAGRTDGGAVFVDGYPGYGGLSATCLEGGDRDLALQSRKARLGWITPFPIAHLAYGWDKVRVIGK
jgi:hypothetical protein